MPSTRTRVERDAKVAEILEVAERRLREGGYDALSMAAIARELGVAQNAVYWYFPSKDELFVAAMRRLLAGIVASKPPGRRSVEGKVLWFVDRLGEVDAARAALHDRARHSEVVAEYAAEVDEAWRRMLGNVLADAVPARDRALVVDTLIATIQGAFLQRLEPRDRGRLIAYALKRLTA